MASNQLTQYAGFDFGLMDPEDDGQVICFPSNTIRCVPLKPPKKTNGKFVSGGFYSPSGKPDFHDEVLRKATQEINEILLRTVKTSTDSRSKCGHLHILHMEKGPMLAWVAHCVRSAPIDGR
ncbi:MAG: hypothetical protein SGJ09_01470 [Phycisphaerae bacterium]|nr:hypothetical protein [Phycisphaerae bacterium]